MHKKTLLTTLLLSAAALPAVSMADMSANVGWVSDYIYRGTFQEDSSAYAGFDYEHDSGLYAGVWGADVGLGLETDLYFGYNGSFGDDGGYTVGFTGYYYTEDDPSENPFDDTYQEINLGISYGIFALDYANGRYEGFGYPQDYTFTTVTISPEKGPYYSYNTFGSDFTGDYIEIGYDFSLSDFDVSVAFLYDLNAGKSDHLLLDEGWTGTVDHAITFGVSHTFSFGDDD